MYGDKKVESLVKVILCFQFPPFLYEFFLYPIVVKRKNCYGLTNLFMKDS